MGIKKNFMRPLFVSLLVVISVGCSEDDGGPCDLCSSDSDCDDEYYCAQFSDGHKRCASEATVCM